MTIYVNKFVLFKENNDNKMSVTATTKTRHVRITYKPRPDQLWECMSRVPQANDEMRDPFDEPLTWEYVENHWTNEVYQYCMGSSFRKFHNNYRNK